MAHPDLVYDQDAMNHLYEPKIVTGGYGDKKFSDECFWAASELFITTAVMNTGINNCKILSIMSSCTSDCLPGARRVYLGTIVLSEISE